MKKTSFIFMTMLTVMLSGLLMACSFKKAEVDFKAEELIVSVNDEINIDDYVEVKGVDISDVDFRFSNASLFETKSGKIKAVSSGKSFIYATYQNNSLDSMQIVVKKQFSSPSNFNVTNGVLQNNDGVLTWNVVSDFFDGDVNATSARSYTVSGSYTTSDGQTKQYSAQKNTNSCQFTEFGAYSLTVTADATGYFDRSQEASIEFGYGLMAVPAEDTLSFASNGLFSWSAVEGAKYKVKLDGKILGDYQTTTSKNISQYLDNADAGLHELSVVAYDAVGTKLSNESKTLKIEKLATPQVEYDTTTGGNIKVKYIEKAESFVFSLKNLSTNNETLITINAADQDILTSFEGLATGAYKLSVTAKTSLANTYQSNSSNKISGEDNVVYKLPSISTFEGLGENELNGNIFKAKIESVQSLFDTNIAVSGLEHELIEGLLVGESQKNFDIQISDVDAYSLGVRFLPANHENTYSGANIFVLNSDESAKLNVVKLAFTGEIEHKYVENNSVFIFNKVENATNYAVEIDGTEIVLDADAVTEVEGKIKIAFNGKIDDLFANYDFKIVAKGVDEKLSINASRQKEIQLLQAPEAIERTDVADKKYVWNPSENASGYRLEIYKLDKVTYEMFVAGNVDLTGLTAKVETVDTAEYVFAKEGYYYVNIFALSGDENLYLDSQDSLTETFCVAEKLVLNTVQLGYDETYVEENPTTAASGYFVRIAKTDYVTRYKISVAGNEQEISISYSESEMWTDFWLTEDFSGESVTISVVALADDETLYLESDAKVLEVERLQSITYDSFGEGGAASIDELSQYVTVNAVEGATEINIKKDADNKVSGDSATNAVYPIGNEANFELTFEILGTKLGNDKLYVGEKVYLDAETTTLRFTRHATPTEFEFNSEKLTFIDTQSDLNNEYVLDLNCKTSAGENFQIKIQFGSFMSVAYYDGMTIPIGLSSTFRSIDGATNLITINLDEILNIINLDETLTSVYAQAISVEFEAYVYKNTPKADASAYEICSLKATLKSDSTKSSLVVDKMASPTLEFGIESPTNYTLKWNSVTLDDSSKNAVTTYKIYSTESGNAVDGTYLTEAEGVFAFEFSKTGYEVGQFHSFYIVASNPYYLDSNSSNVLRIYKLSALDGVKVKTDGTIELLISSLEKDFVSKAVVNEVDYTDYTSLTVNGESLTVKLVGKTETSGNTVTTYIDSDTSTWTMSEFAGLAPADTSLTYNDSGDLTWSAFGTTAGLNSLKYRVYFKDETGAVILHDVSENKINVLDGDVYQKISVGLKEGTITVQIVAYLDVYSVTNGTIYYSGAQTTLGQEMYNAYVYGTTEITKLTTPEVSNVEFESVDFEDATYPDYAEKTVSFDAQNPTTTVYFKGNYGDSVNVMAYVNETTLVYEGTITKSQDGNYSFEVDKVWYEFDENGIMTISIKATVAGTIPSSIGSVEISRAADLSSIEFVKSEENYTTDLNIVLSDDGSSAVGGVVLKIDYVDNDNNSKILYTLVQVTDGTEITRALQDFMEDNLSNGGFVRITAFVNNNSDPTNKQYYLPSDGSKSTEELEVLRAVKESEITRQAGGFVINTDNGTNCIYVVEYGTQIFEVTNETAFYFEFPDDWMNGTYSLSVYAKENGKISSAMTEFEFALSRVPVVDKATVSFVRDDEDKSIVTLTWANVEGASAYLLRVYNKEDDMLIYETTLATAGSGTESYLISDIFGDNYSNVVDFGAIDNPIDFFKMDQNLKFEIVAVGDGMTTNNSKITTLDVVLQGNALLGIVDASTILTVDELGRLNFTGETGESYLYEFYADGVEEQNWQEIVAAEGAVLLDVTEFSKLVPTYYFNINFASKGNEEAFEVDSYVWTTRSTMINLRFNTSIVSMSYNENLASGVAFEILSDGFTTLYAGTSEDALYNGEVVSVKYAKTDISASSNTNVVYSCTFADIIEAFAQKGIDLPVSDSDLTLYFWAYLSENPDGTVTNLNSAPTEFSFVLNTLDNFEEITKIGEVLEGEVVTVHDYANTYAMFTNSDVAGTLETLGMFVKVENENIDNPIIKFLSVEQLTFDDYAGKFVVNLTKIFEESDLIELCGDFVVSFAGLQVSEGTKFVMTNWFKGDTEEFVFTRLDPVAAVRLVEGSVHWTGIEGGKYYVYFIEDLDLETLELGETYITAPTEDVFFDASSFVAANSTYYIAVQVYSGDSEDIEKFTLPSKRVFVSEYVEEEVKPAEVYKNQVNSPLVLKDGQLYFEWPANAEIFAILKQDNPTAADLITDKPFVYPFTFTITDLVNSDLIFRLRFTPTGDETGISQTFDVDARHLLANLFASDSKIKETLTDLYDKEQDDLIKSRLREFIEYCGSATYGIANSRKLFDEIFESLQVGSYSLKYCLLGGSDTVNSSWYDFKNENNENIIYVNAQPTTKILKQTTEDKTVNEYRLFIKRSYITEYDSASSTYVQTLAENYVMKIAAGQDTYMFSISKGIANYSLTLQDSDIESSVTVYQTDENGVEVKDEEGNLNGEYLMFYINHNGGNSLLGVYGEEVAKKAYDMQIYAVGNNVSMSSKSQYHSLTFLSFGDNVSIIDGEFVWTPHLRRTTTVVYKRTNSGEIASEVNLSSDLYYSRFSLDSGEGYYEYVKFMMVGETKANSTFIDSEVYQFNGIYKLAQPTTDQSQTSKTVLSNELGYLSIDLGSENKARLDASYSESNIYNYRIYNNASSYATTRSTSYITVYDERSENAGLDTLHYETGTTNLDTLHSDFTYKDTENDASEFSVALMGSTVTNLRYQVEEEVLEEGEEDDGYNESYYLRTFKRLDVDGVTLLDFNVALRSNFATVEAEMMSDMGDVNIKDSILNWEEVKASASNNSLTVETPVYRIGVVVYAQTQSGEEETTETAAAEELVYYTTKTNFDFTRIEEDLLEISQEAPFIQVTVQALALELTETEGLDGSVELVEGGYAYGNSVYLDAEGNKSSVYVLISNGTTLGGITRFNSVENLCVIDGKLTWTFAAEESLSLTAFKEKYGFEVVQKVGEDEVIVEGDFMINETSGIYTITFLEDKGSMLEGESTFVVYAMEGTNTIKNGIKSFATTIDGVVKLAEIDNNDFQIVTSIDYETLDFSEYFTNNPDNSITLKSNVGGVEQADIIFTRDQSKLYIFNEAPTDTISYEVGYVNTYLVVANDSVGKLNFTVSNALQNTIFSDVSDEFILQRSSWGEGKQIIWNETTQEFSWEYDYNSFNADETLTELSLNYVTSEATTAYLDAALEEPSEYSFASGHVLTVVAEQDGVTTIIHADGIYYISSDTVHAKYLNKAVVLQQTTLFTDAGLSNAVKDAGQQEVSIYEETEIAVLESGATSSKIVYEGQAYYVDSTAIQKIETTFEVGKLFKFVQETETESIIEDEEGKLYKVILSEVGINRPEYTIEATYGEDENSVTRIYTTTENTFKPTIIGAVTISVSVKLGTTNVQSRSLVYDGFAEYNLFASGAGTVSTPYAIITVEQFRNIQYRMSKDDYLQNYHQEGLAEISGDGNQYYFSLSNDITLVGNDATDGILFNGAFEGVLNGNSRTITYLATKTDTLTESIVVSEGNVVGATNYDSSTTFTRGAALFEKLSSQASVTNLNISAIFAEVATAAPNHSLVAALAIMNNGQISNVTLTGFSSKLFGDGASKVVMAYGGLVAINSENTGKISNSKVLANIKLDDQDEPQLIFVGGIAYANLAGGLIEACVVGDDNTTYEISVTCGAPNDTVQVAGIAVTNSTSSTIQNCVNKANLVVNSEVDVSSNITQVYIAGIACYGKGTTLNNASDATTTNGKMTTFNISQTNLTAGDLFAVV